MRIHIEDTHQSVFDYLIGLDKKLTGLTDHQNKLLRLFRQGKRDADVQKERQAKTFLAMMELLKRKR